MAEEPGKGFEIAKGFLKVVADYSKAEEDVDRFTNRIDDKMGAAGTSIGRKGDDAGRAFAQGVDNGLQKNSGGAEGKATSFGARLAGAILSPLKLIFNRWMMWPALAEALAPVIAQVIALGNVLWTIPGILSAGVLGLGALVTGFWGVGAAIRATGQAAKGGGQSAAEGEHQLEMAQRSATDAQKALTQARKDAQRQLRDLTLELSGAKLSEEEATLRVADAQRALLHAQMGGNPRLIEEADLAYREAVQTLEEAHNRTTDLTEAQADAAKKGVEGSDQVQQALRQQADALYNLAEAQRKAAGGSAAAEAAMAKLSPAGRALVDAIHKLSPAWSEVHRGVQQSLLLGLGDSLTGMSGGILPSFRSGLVSIAGVLNGAIRNGMAAFSDKANQSRLSVVFSSAATTLGHLRDATGPLVHAFTAVTAASAKTIASLGWGDKLGEKFNKLTEFADSGRLDKAIRRGLGAFHELGGFLRDLGSIVSSVFHAMSAAGGPAMGVLGSLAHTLATFFKTAAGSQALLNVAKFFAMIGRLVGTALGQVLPAVAKIINALMPVLQPIFDFLTNAVIPVIVGLADNIASALVPAFQAIAPVLSEVFKAFTPLLTMLAGALGQMLVELGPIIGQIAQVLGGILLQAIQVILPVVEQLLPPIMGLVRQLLPPLLNLFKILAGLFVNLMPVVKSLFSLFLTIAVPVLKMLGPILHVVIDVLEIFVAILKALARVGAEVFSALVAVVQGAVKALLAPFTWLVNLGGAIADAVRTGIDKVLGFFSGLKSGAVTKISDFGAWLAGLPLWILKQLGDPLLWLFDAGVKLVHGIWNGIKSTGSYLSDHLAKWFLEQVGINVPDIDSELKNLGGGNPNAADAEDGIRHGGGEHGGGDHGSSMPAGASSLAGSAPPAFIPAAAASLAGAGGYGGIPMGGTRFYSFHVDGKTIATLAIDAVTGAPRQVATNIAGSVSNGAARSYKTRA